MLVICMDCYFLMLNLKYTISANLINFFVLIFEYCTCTELCQSQDFSQVKTDLWLIWSLSTRATEFFHQSNTIILFLISGLFIMHRINLLELKFSSWLLKLNSHLGLIKIINFAESNEPKVQTNIYAQLLLQCCIMY